MENGKRTGRDVAAVMGGIAAGIIGSRLLPPLFATAAGAMKARRGDDPFELLIEDHRTILSLLQQMESASTGSVAKRSRLFLMLKRKLGKHALAEEDVVYPLLHKQDLGAQPSKELYDEHADIKIFLFKLEETLMSGENWGETVRSLRSLIQHHVEEEEQTVFPRLRRILGESRAPVVSGQIRREEALIL